MEDSSQVVQIIDNTPQFNTIIANQEEIIEQLEVQNAYLLEQLNGFSLIANYCYSLIGLILIIVCGFCLWKILKNWFFRGV